MAVELRNRITGLRYVTGRDLTANPHNFRSHPTHQRVALKGLLDEVGIANALIAYETPAGLQLIDGHLRKDTAPDALWPVLVLDVGEAEAKLLLAALDPLAALAGTDAGRLEALLAEVRTDSAGVRELLDGLAESVAELVSDSSASGDSPYTRKIEAPLYEPTGEKPDLASVYDDSRTVSLIAAIDASTSITEDERRFLRDAVPCILHESFRNVESSRLATRIE